MKNQAAPTKRFAVGERVMLTSRSESSPCTWHGAITHVGRSYVKVQWDEDEHVVGVLFTNGPIADARRLVKEKGAVAEVA